jgi:hypothetical protein
MKQNERKANKKDTFLEGKGRLACFLESMKTLPAKDGERRVRLDFRLDVDTENCDALPVFMRREFENIGPHNIASMDFEAEFADRLVELYTGKSVHPATTCSGVTVTAVRMEHLDGGVALRFSFTAPTDEIGHWAIDHTGDPLFIQMQRIQLDLEI